ncbi:hypothetical protein OBBRIDRAFT_124036 [Obba rivulosa]|uniref:DUF7918 domain-containing protein n=1 Tax=Obba rivulosa TaxID=1052685 RepID=A0A8E2DRN0_9APHY|nr:hypothetical protein OBBRIDRAFT_124036 [Obba rivulosa]
MPELRGITISIVCGDSPLKEYSVTEESERTTFHISLKNTLPKEGINAEVLMDGLSMEYYFCDFSSSRRCNGVIINGRERRPYQFSTVETTDDDTVAKPRDPLAQQLGLIEIRVRRCHRKEDATVRVTKDAPSFGVVHEKSKKAGVHRVCLGDSVPAPSIRYRVDHVDSRKDPYGIFLFRYKPEDDSLVTVAACSGLI